MSPARERLRWLLGRKRSDSAVDSALEVGPGVKRRADGQEKTYESGNFEEVAQDEEAERRGEDRDPVERGLVDRVEGSGHERGPKFALGDDDLRDISHDGRSFSATMLAALILLAMDIFGPSDMGISRIAMAATGYAAGLLLTFLAVRSFLRKREAILPPDRLGDGRVALALAACALVVSGDEAGVRLAGWLAVAALGIGGWADGVWIAMVSAWRRLGYWRAFVAVTAGERAARRQYWQVLFPEGQ